MAVSEAQFSFVAGGAAGMLSTCITNPFDVMRSRLAASRDATGVDSKRLSDHLRKMWAEGLVRNFTAGLSVNLITSVPTNAIYLTSYRFLKRTADETVGADSRIAPIFCAFGAVGCTNAALAPLFTVRTRCQIDADVTAMQVARQIMASDGPRGFYRGALVNALGRMVEEATFWFLYENAKRVTQQGDMASSLGWGSLGVVGLSSASKICGSGISYPYNVVMTHLREVDKATQQHKHTTIKGTVDYVYRKDGVKGFYKGAVPHLFRCALSKASQVWSFELIMVSGAGVMYAAQPKKEKE